MSERQKRVLVTGGGSGIGLAIARAFAGGGAEVLIAGRTEARLQQAGLPYITLDVCDANALQRATHDFGPDIFVANAGGIATTAATKLAREEWDRLIALNLTSVFVSAQAAVPAMVERGWGRFIAVGSTASVKGFRYASAYTAAKHGVLGFIRSLALELAKTGVTANALCPGYTDTDIIGDAVSEIVQKKHVTADEAAKRFTDTIPIGRLIAPSEVAGAALWLASDAAAGVTGQAIMIDGGETA